MRTLTLLLLCFLMGLQSAIGQSEKAAIVTTSDCSAVTRRILLQDYSVDQQLAIQSSPEQLACLDYIYAHSYEFPSGQMAIRSQKELFNVDNYKHLRRRDTRVTVYDAYSGLNVTLYSWNEVEQALLKTRDHYCTMAVR